MSSAWGFGHDPSTDFRGHFGFHGGLCGELLAVSTRTSSWERARHARPRMFSRGSLRVCGWSLPDSEDTRIEHANSTRHQALDVCSPARFSS